MVMKKTLYILMGAALVLASCEKVQEVKSLEIERTSGIHRPRPGPSSSRAPAR